MYYYPCTVTYAQAYPCSKGCFINGFGLKLYFCVSWLIV
jgi:hypothetical protein